MSECHKLVNYAAVCVTTVTVLKLPDGRCLGIVLIPWCLAQTQVPVYHGTVVCTPDTRSMVSSRIMIVHQVGSITPMSSPDTSHIVVIYTGHHCLMSTDRNVIINVYIYCHFDTDIDTVPLPATIVSGLAKRRQDVIN